MSDIQSAMLTDVTFERDRLRAVKAELIAVLEGFILWCEHQAGESGDDISCFGWSEQYHQARAAIAKAKE